VKAVPDSSECHCGGCWPACRTVLRKENVDIVFGGGADDNYSEALLGESFAQHRDRVSEDRLVARLRRVTKRLTRGSVSVALWEERRRSVGQRSS
jgi:hypothetical protein